MNAEMQIYRLLTEGYSRARVRNPNYSLRAYSKHLGISPAAVSRILSGSYPIRRRMAEKVLDYHKRSAAEKKVILGELKSRSSPKEKRKGISVKPESPHAPDVFELLDMEKFKMISDWRYYAILSLAETRSFRSDADFIARSLGITAKHAQVAVKRLLKLGFLRETTSGKWVTTGQQFKTTTDVPNRALRQHHMQGLALARKSMNASKFTETDYTSVTMAIDMKKLPKAKKMIWEFERKLCQFLETGQKEEVFRINVQLFPLNFGKNCGKIRVES